MIEVSGLTFTYPGGGSRVLHALGFRIERGEVFGLLGPSGAGKSTTLGVLNGILRGWEGSVVVDGRPLADWGAEYYRRVGVSFELPNHYLALTGRENLEFFRALQGAQAGAVDEVLDRVGLLDAADRPVEEYSKGMKMRLNFARSLLHRPSLWFLDEPTNGLDPVNALRIRELIRERRVEGTTTVLATHDMNTAEAVCDRLAFVVDGRIAAMDRPSVLRRRHGERLVQVTWRRDDGEAESEVYPMEGLGENDRFLGGLRRPGLQSIHSKEASLEEVFIAVTGRRLQ